MRNTVLNFLFLNVQNASGVVTGSLALVWLLLLGAGVASVVSQPRGIGWKLTWILALIMLPFFGMLAYCAYCILTADFSFLRQLGIRNKARMAKLNPGR